MATQNVSLRTLPREDNRPGSGSRSRVSRRRQDVSSADSAPGRSQPAEMIDEEAIALYVGRPSAEGLAEGWHIESADGWHIESAAGQPPTSTQNVRPESRKLRISVLIGASLSQLPIWGFAMSYGVFQEYFTERWTFDGSISTTGIIGTTSNGVMYISMPFMFALFARRFARWRQIAALIGVGFTCFSFLLSAMSTNVWHLVVTQGVIAALGCALVYSPTTLSLGEWFNTSNRALAYGVTLSCKNIVGSVCPFLFRALLEKYGFRNAMFIWTGIAAGSGLLSIALIPPHPSCYSIPESGRRPTLPWAFLRHQTFYVYSIAILLQSAGYGIPQTYLNTYAHEVTKVSSNSATLLLTLFNIPGIASSTFFGYLSDNKYVRLSSAAVTAISAGSSALSAFLFWGLTDQGSMALLVLFSITFGFFAGGYSATWGGVINEMESEAAARNEPIDTGMVYGLLNGARGIGYVAGGLAGVPLRSGAGIPGALFAYGTSYGPLILFTGLSVALGGWSFAWTVCCAARERVRGMRSARVSRLKGWLSGHLWAF